MNTEGRGTSLCNTLEGDQTTKPSGKRKKGQETWCNGARRFVHSSTCQRCVLLCSLWVSGSIFQLCVYSMAGCNISVESNHASFSERTSPFIHISINQFTTFQYTVLYSYSIIQRTLRRLCPLSYRKTHFFEYITTPHSCAFTIDNQPEAKS